MNIVRAKTAGFCMGVSLALHKLDQTISENDDKKIITFGPIIHNPQVLEYYKEKGCKITENIDEIDAKNVVLIRAHGIPLEVENSLKEKSAKIVDATCPKVKQAQLAISNATVNKHLLLFGESEHPEVKGLISYAKNDFFVFDDIKQLENYCFDNNKKYVLAAQTTQDIFEFKNISEFLKDKMNDIEVLNTICDATKKRQDEVTLIAKKVEAMIIVGGRDSGNTRRLAMLSTQEGVKTQHVEIADELDIEILKNKENIGLSAGASTPAYLINEVEQKLNKIN